MTNIRVETKDHLLIDIPLENIEIMFNLWNNCFENNTSTSWEDNNFIYYLGYTEYENGHENYVIEISKPQNKDDNIGKLVNSYHIDVGVMESAFKQLDNKENWK